jgi:hypothetical protein
MLFQSDRGELRYDTAPTRGKLMNLGTEKNQ